ncbi:hypothetical protein [Xanthomonas phage RTH11]|nr:hypothetical protein [Xanthomonas phage RTH11]
MGAHSTVHIAKSVARSLYKAHVGSDLEVTNKQMEDFYDRVLDDRLYNCILVDDDDDRLKPGKYDNATMSEWQLKAYLIQHLDENPGERQNSVTAENAVLRQMLSRVYRGIVTSIDFEKDSASEIQRKLDTHYTDAQRQWEARETNLRG